MCQGRMEPGSWGWASSCSAWSSPQGSSTSLMLMLGSSGGHVSRVTDVSSCSLRTQSVYPAFPFFSPTFFIIQQNSVRPWSEIFLFTKEISEFGHKPNKIGHWMPLKYLVIAWNSAAGSCSNKRVSLFRGSCSEFPCDEYPDAYRILLGTAVSHPIPWRGGMSKLWLFKLANKVEK